MIDPIHMTNAELIANGKANIERRLSPRHDAASVGVEFERLRNELALAQIDNSRLREGIDRLAAENALLRDRLLLLRNKRKAR